MKGGQFWGGSLPHRTLAFQRLGNQRVPSLTAPMRCISKSWRCDMASPDSDYTATAASRKFVAVGARRRYRSTAGNARGNEDSAIFAGISWLKERWFRKVAQWHRWVALL